MKQVFVRSSVGRREALGISEWGSFTRRFVRARKEIFIVTDSTHEQIDLIFSFAWSSKRLQWFLNINSQLVLKQNFIISFQNFVPIIGVSKRGQYNLCQKINHFGAIYSKLICIVKLKTVEAVKSKPALISANLSRPSRKAQKKTKTTVFHLNVWHVRMKYDSSDFRSFSQQHGGVMSGCW